MEAYAGRQFVGIDLHRRRTVIVRTTEGGEVLETVRIVNDVERLASVMARAGQCPEVAAGIMRLSRVAPRRASTGRALIYESKIGSWLIFTVPPLMACTTPLRSVYFVYEPVAYAEDPAEFHTARV